MDKLHECCGCHKYLTKVYKLKSGKYVCRDCLDKIDKEQEMIEKHIIKYLEEQGITNPETQINTLESIVTTMKYENNLLDKKTLKLVEKMYKGMEEAFNEK